MRFGTTLAFSESPIDDLALECRSIAKDYAENSSAGGANANLSRAVYDLTLRCMRNDLMDEALDLARSNAKRDWLEAGSNPFQIVLSAVFCGKGPKPSTSTFERIWKQLWHAFRHFVPTPFLEGFLLQSRTKDICSRALQPDLEAGYDDWVTVQLGIYLAESDCGFELDYPWLQGYPEYILEGAEALAAELEELDEAAKLGSNSLQSGDDDDCYEEDDETDPGDDPEGEDGKCQGN